MSKRDEFLTRMKARLDEWNQEVDKLEDRIRIVAEEIREKYQSQIDALRRKRQEGERKLEQIRTVGEGKWEQLRAETEHAWEAMKDALATVKAHYRKDDDTAKRSSNHRD